MDGMGRSFIRPGHHFILWVIILITALQATKEIGLEGFGILTPIGGLLLVAGWISFFLGIPSLRMKDYTEK
jgi:uncharacterized membrane protein YgdD (TMEM256/DUF423 family)